MVETTFKSSVELIEAIREANADYDTNGYIHVFYRNLVGLRDAIKANTSTDLFDKFNVEMQCVYYEHLYGDGEYTDHVVKDCIEVLDLIIDEIIFKED